MGAACASFAHGAMFGIGAGLLLAALIVYLKEER
jgi:hypothetical protein